MGDTRLSPARRAADRARLADEVVDVLVVGGGLSGAWVALDAAVRGLAVGLLEAGDWAAGASGRPAVLLSRAGTPARTALRERGRLLRTAAPHLVRSVPLVCPRPTPALAASGARRGPGLMRSRTARCPARGPGRRP